MEPLHRQKHFRVNDLAALWGYSPNTIISQFANEPGVLRLTNESDKRKLTVLSIPDSVAQRVHERLSMVLPATRIIRLKDRQRPTKIIRLKDLNR
jgi:hypothetical protein